MDNTMMMIKERNDWLEFNNIHNNSRFHCCSTIIATAAAAVVVVVFAPAVAVLRTVYGTTSS